MRRAGLWLVPVVLLALVLTSWWWWHRVVVGVTGTACQDFPRWGHEDAALLFEGCRSNVR